MRGEIARRSGRDCLPGGARLPAERGAAPAAPRIVPLRAVVPAPRIVPSGRPRRLVRR
jgi:hypothetical protein